MRAVAGTVQVCTFDEAERLVRSHVGSLAVGGLGCVRFVSSSDAVAPADEALPLVEAVFAIEQARRARRIARVRMEDGVPTELCLAGKSCDCVGSEPPRPGALVERTYFELCTHCGHCVSACGFGARSMLDCELEVDRSKCHGCGLCVGCCPELCIAMIARR